MARNIPTALTISQRGERLDIEIVSGATFGPVLARMSTKAPVEGDPNVPVDLTGCVVQGTIRTSATAPGAPLAEISANITNASDGNYSFEVPASVIEEMPAPLETNDYWWNLELVDAQQRVIPLYYGNFTVYATAARPDIEATDEPCGC